MNEKITFVILVIIVLAVAFNLAVNVYQILNHFS